MKPSYQNLCTEFYDLTKPEAGPKEVAFYRDLLKATKGPFLEAMCGSGRLLIPLLRTGLVIDGVDNSAHMLKSCRQRCENQHLHVKLLNQPLQDLTLSQKYSLIFIAIGSFQLIKDRIEALRILKNLRQNLLPGGKLIIETFIPWDGIKEGIRESILADQSDPIISERTIQSPDGFEMINRSTVTLYFKEQLEMHQTHYEKRGHGELLLTEEEEYAVRWYYRHEMELFLEKAGFSSIEIKDESFEQTPQATIYIAYS
ncbi:MAG: hypothetical protein A3E26_01660 [Chlamydiae bacterium RIFCSPHIGHO2_12_FULL_49_32]|nr:MAG: hypothetical protein A3E26_01660 [Chlamydiae bacterium RIFCSPHIGHO2_12_FULL_49_32]